MEINELISFNLKRIRIGQNLTQRFIAEYCNVSTQTVRDIEAGRRCPSVELLGKIAQAISVKPSALLESSESAPVIQMPVSKTLQRLLLVPDYVYDAIDGVSKDDEVWGVIEELLKEVSSEARNKDRSNDG